MSKRTSDTFTTKPRRVASLQNGIELAQEENSEIRLLFGRAIHIGLDECGRRLEEILKKSRLDLRVMLMSGVTIRWDETPVFL